MRKVAVYGSLLQKLHNHRTISRHIPRGGAKFLGEDVLNIPYKMFDLGSYPALLPMKVEDLESNKVKNDNIFVEVYEVDDETNRCIEGLEGYHGEGNPNNYYNKAKVHSDKFGDVEIYVFNDSSYEGFESFEVDPEDGVTNWRKYHVKQEF